MFERFSFFPVDIASAIYATFLSLESILICEDCSLGLIELTIGSKGSPSGGGGGGGFWLGKLGLNMLEQKQET